MRFAALGDVEVTHDFQARDHGLAEMRRHFGVRLQGAVHPKPDAGLELARHRLDVNVRHALVVGIQNDLVDKLDQFVVCRRRFQGIVVVAFIHRRAVHVGQHFIDAATSGLQPKDLPQRVMKLGMGGDVVDKFADFWEHLLHDA